MVEINISIALLMIIYVIISLCPCLSLGVSSVYVLRCCAGQCGSDSRLELRILAAERGSAGLCDGCGQPGSAVSMHIVCLVNPVDKTTQHHSG